MIPHRHRKFVIPAGGRSLVLLALLAATGAMLRANTAVEPVPRDPAWVKRHEGFVAIAKQGGIDLLFLGDSITDFWRLPEQGKPVWDQYYGSLHAADFGISGDRTQHVLWRIENGELEGLNPKVVVLMIGTNNTGLEKGTAVPRNTNPETIAGVTAVVQELRVRLPHAKILLLAIFPRGDKGDPERQQIAEINGAIARLDDGQWVHFLDIGPKFLEPDGTLSREIMPDLLHPSAKGYGIWAEAIKAPLAQLLRP